MCTGCENVLRCLPRKWTVCGSLEGGVSLGDRAEAKRGSGEQPQIQKYLCLALPSQWHINFKPLFLNVWILKCKLDPREPSMLPLCHDPAVALDTATARRADPRLRLSPGGGPAVLQERIRAGWLGCRASSSTAVFAVQCKTHLFFQAVSQKCIWGGNSLAMHFPQHFSCCKYCFCVLQTKVKEWGRNYFNRQLSSLHARIHAPRKVKIGYKYYTEAHYSELNLHFLKSMTIKKEMLVFL